MEQSAAVVTESATVLRFVRGGLGEALADVFGGPVGLTPDALDPLEVRRGTSALSGAARGGEREAPG